MGSVFLEIIQSLDISLSTRYKLIATYMTDGEILQARLLFAPPLLFMSV